MKRKNPSASEKPRQHALRLLARWVPAARRHLHRLPDDGGICYGIGNHGHWALQANGTAFTAFATLATASGTDCKAAGMSRKDLRDNALGMLRFALQGHHAGGGACTDGKNWGHSWISVLCLERMMHGLEALWPHLTATDQRQLRAVLLSEAEWLLDHYPVTAGLVENNHPESNMWNGTFLRRVALMYPRAARAAECRVKGTRFLLNAISVPADAEETAVVAGRQLRKWHTGANFFASYACNHHHYLNLGYIYITLSNLAMLHFSCRTQGWKAPAELYHHAADLWRLAKTLTCDDGRLLRIGGDTRVRYCYCQDYGLPVWLLAQDWLGDQAAAGFETGWLKQVEREQASNPDGSFLGGRLRQLESVSPLYYTRLEGDRAGTLSMVACWRSRFKDFADASPTTASAPTPLVAWSDEYHGAAFVKGPRRAASWVWGAGEGPTGLCLDPARSDLAEWRLNLAGEVGGMGVVNTPVVVRNHTRLFNGGFATGGRWRVRSTQHVGEGDTDEDVADLDLALAALPDGRTVVVLQRARTLNRAFVRIVKGLHLVVPNDLFNGGVRRYADADGGFRTKSRPGNDQLMRLRSRWLNVDGSLGVRVLHGANEILVYRPAERQIGIKAYPHRPMTGLAGGFLYADEICVGACSLAPECHPAGTVLFDLACELRTGLDAKATAAWAASRGDGPVRPLSPVPDLRAIRVAGADGCHYLLAANFGDSAVKAAFAGKAEPLSVGPGLLKPHGHRAFVLQLEPGEAMLCRMRDDAR